jgi:cytochrome c
MRPESERIRALMRTKRIYLGHGAMLWVGILVLCALGRDLVYQERNAARSADWPARGNAVAETCQTCHSLHAVEHRVGPHLVQLIGRRAGTMPGYDYSAAMRDSGLVWTRPQLRTFLLDPMRAVPGTAMALAGWSEADVDAVIDFLDSEP